MIELNKIKKLIDPKIKKNFYLIVFFNFIISILEFLSIASIYPALLIITGVSSNKIIDKIYLFFDINLSEKGLTFFLTLILFLIIFKNILSIILNWYIQNYILKNYNFISLLIIKKMLRFNYLDVINLTSPIFIRNSKEVVFSFRQYIMSLILMSTEIVTVSSLLLLLMLISFKITIITIIILLIFLLILIKLSKSKITNLGKVRNEAYAKLNSSLIEIFNSFRELKIYSNIEFYIKNFLKQNISFAKAQRNIEFFTSITRNLFELLVVLFLALSILLIDFEIDINILPTAGIFVFVFFRLYPSFTKISSLKTTLNSNENSVEILLEIQKTKIEIYNDLSKNIPNFVFKKNIKIENLSFGYDQNNIFENLNLVINKGDIIGISGKNGSGKTTLCNIILSIIKPKNGRIIIDDTYNLNDHLKEYRGIISFIPKIFFC